MICRHLFFVFVLFAWPLCNITAQFFTPVDTLVLEENDEVLLGAPSFEDISDDLLLVIDDSQSKVLLYSKKGELKSYFGREGRGPGDLENPTSATFLPDGNVIVTEFSGRITKFNEDGEDIAITKTKIIRLNGSKLLPNGKVLLIGGMHTPENHYLLYLFNPESMEIEKSFFLLPFDPTEYAMQPLTLAEPSFAVVCSNKIVAMHAMLPILFYYDFEGNLLEKKRINSEFFSQMEKVLSQNNPKKTMENYGKASWVMNMFCVGEHDVLIQFIANITRAGNPIGLMLVNEEGKVLNESLEMPGVLFSEPGTGVIYLREMKSGLINQFIKAELIRK